MLRKSCQIILILTACLILRLAYYAGIGTTVTKLQCLEKNPAFPGVLLRHRSCRGNDSNSPKLMYKYLHPITVTLSGMLTLVRFPQWQKILLGSSVTPSDHCASKQRAFVEGPFFDPFYTFRNGHDRWIIDLLRLTEHFKFSRRLLHTLADNKFPIVSSDTIHLSIPFPAKISCSVLGV